jgi:phage shock protein A
MGIFDRLRRVIKANVNSAIDKAEDPEKMLNQLIVDMNQQLIEAKKAVATAIADEKRLERQVLEYKTQSSEWEKRAILAIQAAEQDPSKQAYYEDLAKQALIRKKENEDVSNKLQEQFGAQHAAVEKLKLSLKDLQNRMDEAQRRRTLLVARAKRAEASRKIQEQISGMSDTSAFEAFEKMAQKVDQIEAEADALTEIESSTRSTSLENEFKKLEAGTRSDMMLEEFKQKMAIEQQERKRQAAISNKSTQTNTGRIDSPKTSSAVVPAEVDLMMQELKRKMHSGS